MNLGRPAPKKVPIPRHRPHHRGAGPESPLETIVHLKRENAELKRVNAASLETITTYFRELARIRTKSA